MFIHPIYTNLHLLILNSQYFPPLLLTALVTTSQFFFFNLLIFNWRVIGLQYCVGFCHTSIQINHRYTYVLSLLNLPPTPTPSQPSRVSQSTRFELPASYSESPQLSTSHMVMYMFPRYSLKLSHPLPPPLCLQVFSLCLHLHCCPANRFIHTIILDAIYMH